jgi:ParB family chromosome partitioning protein
VQAYLRNGHLSAGHAKVVLGLATPDEQRLAAERVIKAGLNVRQTEDLVAAMQARAAGAPSAKTSGGRGPVFRDAHVVAVESRLQERFGTKVNLRYRHGRGAVEIRFFNDDDLERILQVVGVGLE